MQLWRPRETPSGPFPASTWDAHFPRQPGGRKGKGTRGLEGLGRRNGGQQHSGFVPGSVLREDLLPCHLIPALGTDRIHLQPAAWRDSVCLSYVDAGYIYYF